MESLVKDYLSFARVNSGVGSGSAAGRDRDWSGPFFISVNLHVIRRSPLTDRQILNRVLYITSQKLTHITCKYLLSHGQKTNHDVAFVVLFLIAYKRLLETTRFTGFAWRVRVAALDRDLHLTHPHR